MKRVSITLFTLFLLAVLSVSAQDTKQVLNANQVGQLDVSGKWSGTRNQYSWDRKSFIESFQYEFNLTQEGNLVTGTSTIIDSKGDYADMKLEGMMVGNKLYFHEYQIVNAIRPEGRVWCFKSGELNFTWNGTDLLLTGATPSYMETNNYPCSGGETNIKQVDNSANVPALTTAAITKDGISSANLININAYPNPFVESANINYSLPESAKVQLEIYDISGKIVTTLFTENQNAGSYNYNFSGKNFAANSGMYIVKLTVNDNIYSREMVQMR
jgi:hypothetical protein